MFTVGMGHEQVSLVAVLTAFFGGMAAGAVFLDRRLSASPRPQRWYGALELIIGLWGLGSGWLIPWVNGIALAGIGDNPPPALHGLIAGVLAFLTLLPATFAIGATLPAMERWLSQVTPSGRCVARLYGWNTLGGVAGTLGSAFWLMPHLGLRGTATVLASLNLACAALAWLNSSHSNPEPIAAGTAKPMPPTGPTSTRSHAATTPLRTLYLLLFITGGLGIGFEIVGVRLLAQVMEGTLYSFAAALAVYLVGNAIGATLPHRRAAPWRTLLPALGGAVAVGTVALHLAPTLQVAARSVFGPSWSGTVLTELALSAAVFGPATVVMGALYTQLVQSARREHGGVGRGAACNTLGGAFAGWGFSLMGLPLLGANGCLAFIAVGYVVPAWILPFWETRPPNPPNRKPAWLLPAGAGLFVALTFWLTGNLPGLGWPPNTRVLSYHEGAMASVAVLEEASGARSLRVNHRFQMGGSAAALAERRQAMIPLLLHPAPRHALFLGPGTGISLGAAAAYPGIQADGVELVPEVIDAMKYFSEWNHQLPQAPGVRLIAGDARRFVRTTRQFYDVIVADLFHPAQDGAGFLYTREHFHAVRDRLEPDGLFCQWLPLHQLDEPTLRSIIRTFLDTFGPQTHAFLLHFNVDIPVLGLVGTRRTLRMTLDQVEPRSTDPRLRELLRSTGLERSIQLLGCVAGDATSLGRYAGDAPVGTDDFPSVLFTAPRQATPDPLAAARLINGFLAQNPTDLPALLTGKSTAGSTTVQEADVAHYVAARDVYLRGLAGEAAGRLPEAITLYLESTAKSLYFTAAYARCVTIIQVMHRADPAGAKRIYERLEQARPDHPLGRKLLAPLFESVR